MINDDDLLNWSYDGSDLLEVTESWYEESGEISEQTYNKLGLVMPIDVQAMVVEVAELKRLGRDPTTTKFKPLRQDEPASADFEYHMTFYNKDPKRYNAIGLLQLPLAHMRAGAYNFETHKGLGFVIASNLDGSLVKLQIAKKGVSPTYYHYEPLTGTLKAIS